MTSYLESLNVQQYEVATSLHPKIVCMAGAGTGKTHTLIARMEFLVSELKIDPEKMLVLTFTRAAAKEFEDRYSKLRFSSVYYPTFNTFHAFCYQLILNNNVIREKLGYRDCPKVINDAECNLLWKQAELETGIKLTQDERKPSFNCKPSREFEVGVVKKKFNKLLVSQNKITFDKMCLSICELFTSNWEGIKYLKDQYKYIFVDEFQDTDSHQWEFIQSFQDISDLFVVGDIRQSLYRFRDADSTIMKSLIENPKWKTFKLETNYRSSQQICNFANNILEKFKAYDSVSNLNLLGRFTGCEVEHTCSSHFEDNIQSIIQDDTAILCRTNRDVKSIERLLTQSGIKYKVKFESPSIKLWLCALNDSIYLEHLITLCTVEDQLKFLAMKKIASEDIVLYELHLKFPDVVARVNQIKSRDDFEDIKLKYELDKLSLHTLLHNPQDENHEVYVGTIHSVKGLEFKTVYVYNVGDRSFQLNNEDNLNCYYVACTRPKERLVIVESL